MSVKLEKHHNCHKLKPYGKYVYRGVEYCVADGGPFQYEGAKTEESKQVHEKVSQGFYETAWTIMKGEKAFIERPLVFDKYHDVTRYGFNDRDKQKGRVDAAHEDAKKTIDELKQAGIL